MCDRRVNNTKVHTSRSCGWSCSTLHHWPTTRLVACTSRGPIRLLLTRCALSWLVDSAMTLLLQAYLSRGRALAVFSSTTTCPSSCRSLALPPLAEVGGCSHRSSSGSSSSSSNKIAHLHARHSSFVVTTAPSHACLALSCAAASMCRLLAGRRLHMPWLGAAGCPTQQQSPCTTCSRSSMQASMQARPAAHVHDLQSPDGLCISLSCTPALVADHDGCCCSAGADEPQV